MSEEMNHVTVKSLIVNGKEHVEDVETEVGVFKVRPLTKGEKDRIAAIENRGATTNASGKGRKMQRGGDPDVDVTIDHEKLAEAQAEAFNLTLACGLSVGDEKVTVEDIKKLDVPDRVLDTIYIKIRLISGVATRDVAAFPGDSERTGLSVVDDNGPPPPVENS